MAGLGGSLPIRRSTGGSPPFDTLTDELLVEILRRLPVKDANRCKCVAKRWLNSISDSYYARCYTLYRSSSPRPSALFFHPRSMKTHTLHGIQLASDNPIFDSPGFSFSFLPSSPPPSEPVRFLASSNGLVLCCAAISTFQWLCFVCNPLTKHWIALPPPPSRYNGIRIGFICTRIGFICSPFHSGNDQIDDEELEFPGIIRFIVVQILESETSSRRSHTLKLEIFYSETGQWAEFDFSCDEPQFISDSSSTSISAVVSNGILHWRWFSPSGIFAFDPHKSDQYRIIELPKDRNTDNEVFCAHLFGECQGRLRYAEYGAGNFSIWEIKDYNSGEWVLEHRFHKGRLVSENDKLVCLVMNSCHLMKILAFHPIDEDGMFLGFPGRVIQCNIRSLSLKPFCSLASRTAYVDPSRTFPYVLPWCPTPVPPS